MNKIVVPRYPVEKLPADLRGDLESGSFVTVILDPNGPNSSRPDEGLTLDEIFALADKLPRKTPEEIVDEIRALRDEWD